MPFIQVKVIENVFTSEQKQQIVRSLTDALVRYRRREHAACHVVRGRGGAQRRLGHRRQSVDNRRCPRASGRRQRLSVPRLAGSVTTIGVVADPESAVHAQKMTSQPDATSPAEVALRSGDWSQARDTFAALVAEHPRAAPMRALARRCGGSMTVPAAWRHRRRHTGSTAPPRRTPSAPPGPPPHCRVTRCCSAPVWRWRGAGGDRPATCWRQCLSVPSTGGWRSARESWRSRSIRTPMPRDRPATEPRRSAVGRAMSISSLSGWP